MAIDLAMQPGTDLSVRSVVIEKLKALPRAAGVDDAIDLLKNGRPKDPAVLAIEKDEAANRAEQDRRVQKVVSSGVASPRWRMGARLHC